MKYYLFYILEWGQFSVKMGTPYNLAYCSKSGNIHIRSILKNSCWDFFWCRFTHLNLSTHKIHIKTVFLSLTDLLLLDEHLCMFVCAHIHAYTQFNAEFASSCHPATMTKEEITIVPLKHSSNTTSVTIMYPFIYIFTLSVGKKFIH